LVSGTRVTWDWTDYLGLTVVLVGVAFLITVIAALIKGESPLKVLGYIADPLTAIFKRGPG
jgi:hypothetical protein